MRLAGCAVLVGAALAAHAQTATAVQTLDMNQFTSPWFEQARLPNRREKPCVGENVMLYSLGDKKQTFQVVTSCQIGGGNWMAWNDAGKLDPAGSGRLRVRTLWPFTRPYWVVAADPGMQWMIVGSPNHKAVWLLSRTPRPEPGTVDAMTAQAAAAGFNTAKLVHVTQHETANDVVAHNTPTTPKQPTPAPASAK